LDDSLLVLGSLAVKLVLIVTVSSTIKIVDDNMFRITEILYDFYGVEQLVNSDSSFCHNFVHRINNDLIILVFENSEAWASVVSVEHASFSLLNLVLRECLTLAFRILIWRLQDFAVVRPDQKKFTDGFNIENVLW